MTITTNDRPLLVIPGRNSRSPSEVGHLSAIPTGCGGLFGVWQVATESPHKSQGENGQDVWEILKITDSHHFRSCFTEARGYQKRSTTGTKACQCPCAPLFIVHVVCKRALAWVSGSSRRCGEVVYLNRKSSHQLDYTAERAIWEILGKGGRDATMLAPITEICLI